jgi:hypothetical protein
VNRGLKSVSAENSAARPAPSREARRLSTTSSFDCRDGSSGGPARFRPHVSHQAG